MELSNRIKVYNKYKKLLKSVNHDTQKHFIKDSVLGEGLQGKVYKYCNKTNCLKDPVAIKKIYIEKKQAKYINNTLDKKALKYGNYIELAAGKLINQLLLQNITPNFAFNYANTFSERNGICDNIYPYSSYYYNEYIGDAETYEDWVDERHNADEWNNVYFQVIVNIYILQKYFNMIHLDLHARNILVKKIKKGGFWKYIINGQVYKIPNLGFQIYILDFGFAWMPDLFKSEYRLKVHRGYDLQKLFRSTLNYSTSSDSFKKKIRVIINRLKNEKDTTFTSIIDDIFSSSYGNKSKNAQDHTLKIIQVYNTDLVLNTNTLPKVLRSYVSKIKNINIDPPLESESESSESSNHSSQSSSQSSSSQSSSQSSSSMTN